MSSTPRWMRLTSKTVTENSPTILSGLAIAGVVATTALAIRATPAALRMIGRAKDEKANLAGPLLKDQDEARKEDLSLLEVVQVTWKGYIPAAATGLATIACIVGAHQIGLRRTAALMGAYTIADNALREYKDEVLKQIGVNKEQKVRDGINSRKIDEHPVADSQVIIVGGGEALMFDTLTGRYFLSDVESIRRAENELKAEVIRNMYAAQNLFYDLVGLERVAFGEEHGWNIDNMPELVFTSHLASDGRPCLAIDYKQLPKVGYDKL